ncbi:50S ribosomal protein L17 [Candidatus Woesebacteria bacterium]|nr:50S ribosomal protein L17 [Candidatus Woesebacteria bacterium]
MRHRIAGKKQGDKPVFRAVMRALVEHGSIETSMPRARKFKSFAEKIVTTARKDSLSSRRRVSSQLGADAKTTAGIFKTILPRFRDRKSGFLRIIRLAARRGDGSVRAKLEWVEDKVKTPAKDTKVKKSAKKEK